MSEWLDNQKKQSNNIRKLLQERIEKANPHRELTAEETKHLNKLEGVADKLKRGENLQNRQFHTWLRHVLASRVGLQGLQPSPMVSNLY